MDVVNQLIFLGGGLAVISILATRLSARLGAPLLLIFLVLGMLAGEDGIGGLHFSNFRLTFAVGSVALAIILFEGGLKMPRDVLKARYDVAPVATSRSGFTSARSKPTTRRRSATAPSASRSSA